VNRFLQVLGALLIAGSVQAGDLKPYSGEPLPGFILSDMGGKAHSLSHYRGKVVMLNFWATYCGPCIKEIPSMQRLKEKLAGKPFEILAINMAEEQADVAAFLQRHKIQVNFPILLDQEGTVIEQWMISAVPTTFIIDPEGRIKYALYGGLEWDNDEVINTINGLLK
jgi:thiol-disulfide isomerase/thioredoxin